MRITQAFETFEQTVRRLHIARSNHLGYPYNLTASRGTPSVLSDWLINNLGDPYYGSHFASEVCGLERDVVSWLMSLWQCGDHTEFWGSVVASGTEGNLWAIYLAREALPDAVLVHSQDAHYSIPKAARILRMTTRTVASLDDGSIDLSSLARTLHDLRGQTVILALTCGTTIKGAHDDIAGAIAVLDRAGFGRDARFIHVDGALNAMVLPFVDAAPRGICPSFEHAIDSISTSGHKMIGTPMPCGVLIARRQFVDAVAERISYLRSHDTTLMGSRNGHAVLALWSRLHGHQQDGFRRDVLRCLSTAARLAQRLRGCDVPVLLNPLSLTLVFPEPSDDIVRKYQLASKGGESHAIVMPSVTDALLDQFCHDYLAWWTSSDTRTRMSVHPTQLANAS